MEWKVRVFLPSIAYIEPGVSKVSQAPPGGQPPATQPPPPPRPPWPQRTPDTPSQQPQPHEPQRQSFWKRHKVVRVSTYIVAANLAAYGVSTILVNQMSGKDPALSLPKAADQRTGWEYTKKSCSLQVAVPLLSRIPLNKSVNQNSGGQVTSSLDNNGEVVGLQLADENSVFISLTSGYKGNGEIAKFEPITKRPDIVKGISRANGAVYFTIELGPTSCNTDTTFIGLRGKTPDGQRAEVVRDISAKALNGRDRNFTYTIGNGPSFFASGQSADASHIAASSPSSPITTADGKKITVSGSLNGIPL